MQRGFETVHHLVSALRTELSLGPAPRFALLSRFGFDFLGGSARRSRPIELALPAGCGRLLARRITLGGVTVLALDVEATTGRDAFDDALPVLIAGQLRLRGVVDLLAACGLEGFGCAPTLATVRDWIRFGDEDPLRGLDLSRAGPRFPEMRGLADRPELRAADELLRRRGFSKPAVAIARRGPSGATDAELAVYRRLGADLLVEGAGAEAVAARQQGLPHVTLALVLDAVDAAPHADPGALADAAGALLPKLAELLPELLRRLDSRGNSRDNAGLGDLGDSDRSNEHEEELAT